jgi:hypothetical protein
MGKYEDFVAKWTSKSDWNWNIIATTTPTQTAQKFARKTETQVTQVITTNARTTIYSSSFVYTADIRKKEH